MALIYRNGRPYLYRSVRRGGRVTSEYVACGESAVRFARKEAQDRAERDMQRAETLEERDALDAVNDERAPQQTLHELRIGQFAAHRCGLVSHTGIVRYDEANGARP